MKYGLVLELPCCGFQSPSSSVDTTHLSELVFPAAALLCPGHHGHDLREVWCLLESGLYPLEEATLATSM